MSGHEDDFQAEWETIKINSEKIRSEFLGYCDMMIEIPEFWITINVGYLLMPVVSIDIQVVILTFVLVCVNDPWSYAV